MNPMRIAILGTGALVMSAVIFLGRKQYPGIKTWKLPILCAYLTVAGVAGTLLMFYIENGYFKGTSFFGAILLVPLLMLPMLLLRIPFSTLMDIIAPSGCAMVAVMKLDCIRAGCCKGIYLTMLGLPNVRFPSQLTELFASLIIMLQLLRMQRAIDGRYYGKIYPYYLLYYGITRFFLNLLRADLSPFVWILPPGNFWSLVSIAAGLLWLGILHCRSAKKNA